MTNNFLLSLFDQGNFALNFVKTTQTSEHYNYRSYLENFLTYGIEPAATHLTNAYWYRDTGDMLHCEPAAVPVTAKANKGFITC